MMKQPAHWSRDQAHSITARVLSPIGCLYWGVSRLRRRFTTPYQSTIPVICIGNATAGGAGKTPVAMAVAQCLQAKGKSVHFLSRGYGGSLPGPVLIRQDHDAGQVGDEPLLLSRTAPVTISRDRVAGVRAIEQQGSDIAIMDDGYQNPSLAKQLSVLVVDAGFGFGNGRIIPAGPLREPVTNALDRADAVIMLGGGPDEPVLPEDLDIPVIRGKIEPDLSEIDRNASYVAFAGIGRPEKFRETLAASGLDVKAFHAFPDHHPYEHHEIEKLIAETGAGKFPLITTEKDFVRLPESIKSKVHFLPISIRWEKPQDLELLLETIC